VDRTPTKLNGHAGVALAAFYVDLVMLVRPITWQGINPEIYGIGLYLHQESKFKNRTGLDSGLLGHIT
jgi:hypothetical protein